MSTVAAAWVVSGIAIGVGHALALWRETRRARPALVPSPLLRLASVGGLLWLAALTGGLLPAAIGWGIGFPSAAVVVLVARTP